MGVRRWHVLAGLVAVWETTVVPAPHIEVVTDDVVLVGVGAGGPSDDHHQKPPLRTVAIDARTGTTLWESQDPMWPHAIA